MQAAPGAGVPRDSGRGKLGGFDLGQVTRDDEDDTNSSLASSSHIH
jgi:hypothetical protein